MRRAKIYLIAAAALLALAGCDRALEPAGGAGDAITIEASVGPMTKVTYDGAGSAFAAGDQLALYAWTGTATEIPARRAVDGVVNTFDGSTWTPASLMRWADASTPHYFLGVSPAPAAAITDLTAVPYTLDPADYTASDLLLASNFGTDGAGVKPSATPVPLAFDHAMAKLAVNLKFRSEWATVPASVSVTITAKTGATVNYLTKSVTATGTAAPLVLPAADAAASGYNLSFGSLMVPQDGVRRIAVLVDGMEYAYEYGSDIPLNSGKATTLGLILGRDKLELEGIGVADWETETLAEAEAEMDMLTVPLTIEAKTAETHVTFILSSIVAANSVEYRTSSGMTWCDWATYTGSAILLKNQGDKVQFRGDNATYATGTANYSHFQFDKDCYVYGNVMSLVGGEDFSSCFTLTGKCTFVRLFRENLYLLSHASKRLLLPATTLAEECYRGMFELCPFLTVAPALPATTLASYCYDEMFEGCQRLNSVTCLAVDISAHHCTYEWLLDVAATGTFTAPACMEGVWPTDSGSGIPSGWTFEASPGGDEPAVTTGAVSSVTTASATLSGSYKNMTDVRDYGFYWGTSSTALSNQTHLNSSANKAETFSSPISSLDASTTYYYQAYVQVLEGGQLKEYKGEVKSFSTAASAGQGGYRPYLENYEMPAIALKAGTTYGSGSEKSGCGYKWYNHETANANQMVATHTYKYNGKVYRNYTCLVDKTKKAPLWSAFVMHKDAYPDNSVGRTGSWTDDPAISGSWQQSGVDSPYSRGNFVASNYRQVCDDANKATFYHTNQAPQYQTSFNDGVWNSLENAVKSNAPTGRDTLYVVVGVLYETSQMSSGVPIPSHFYKLLMKCSFDGSGAMTAAKGVAYLFTNEAHSGDKYTDAKFRTTIDAIEERTGFNFFANVPADLQDAAEQQSAALW